MTNNMYKYPEDKKSIEYKLQAPFEPDEIEWRPQSCGISNGKPWVMALAYVQARAIQNRLDSVFGFDGWETQYREFSKGIICRLTCEGSYKEDGSDETDIEAFKGGISSAFKRVAASGYGIGRYLYYLDSSFANCSLEYKKGWHKTQTKNKQNIYWEIPKLPSWAIPEKETIYNLNSIVTINKDKDLEIKKQEPIEFDMTDNSCSKCGSNVNDNVKKFSINKYGSPVCIGCQKK